MEVGVEFFTEGAVFGDFVGLQVLVQDIVSQLHSINKSSEMNGRVLLLVSVVKTTGQVVGDIDHLLGEGFDSVLSGVLQISLHDLLVVLLVGQSHLPL